MNSVNAFDEAAGWTDTQQEAIRIEDEGDWHHTPSESSSLCSHCPRSAVAVIVVPVRSSSDMLSLSLFSALRSHCSLTIYMPSTRDSGTSAGSRIERGRTTAANPMCPQLSWRQLLTCSALSQPETNVGRIQALTAQSALVANHDNFTM